eukprot:1013536-Rhodomonas_salina.3
MGAKKTFSPEEISASILMKMKEIAEGIALCVCYAMSGADIAFATLRLPRSQQLRVFCHCATTHQPLTHHPLAHHIARLLTLFLLILAGACVLHRRSAPGSDSSVTLRSHVMPGTDLVCHAAKALLFSMPGTDLSRMVLPGDQGRWYHLR